MKDTNKKFDDKMICKLEIEDFKMNLPDFKTSTINKDILVKDWILANLKNLNIQISDNIYALPDKSIFSKFLGVSIGTIQSAIRYLEDENYLFSKQRLGTFWVTESTQLSKIIKSHSKKDEAYSLLKRYVNSLEIGSKLPSSRMLAQQNNFSLNTIRLALEKLKTEGVIKMNKEKHNSYFIINHSEKEDVVHNPLNLAEKISDKLLNYIEKNHQIGDKIQSHSELAKKFCLSIKSINDAIKKLEENGYLKTRRGKYGTIVIQNKRKDNVFEKPETSIFAKASVAFEYNYQKIKNEIVQYMMNNYEVGDKLPTMQEFAKIFDVSTNTIRKALNDLYLDGYLIFNRGRFGGTFIIQMPERVQENAFKWLAVSEQYRGARNK